MRNKREFFKELIYTYFIVVTLVVAGTYVMGMTLRPEATFGYDAFLAPLLYGFLGVLPTVIMYSDKELSVGQVIIRKVLQLIVLEVILLLAGPGNSNLSKEHMPEVLFFVFAVFVIFVLVHVIMFFLDYGQAARMNKDLIRLKQEQ